MQPQVTYGQLTPCGRLVTCGGFCLPCLKILCPSSFPQTFVNRSRHTNPTFHTSHSQETASNLCPLICCLICGLLILFIFGSFTSSVFNSNRSRRFNPFLTNSDYYDEDPNLNINSNPSLTTGGFPNGSPNIATQPQDANVSPVSAPVSAPPSQNVSVSPQQPAATSPQMPSQTPAQMPAQMPAATSTNNPGQHIHPTMPASTNQHLANTIPNNSQATVNQETNDYSLSQFSNSLKRFFDRSLQNAKNQWEGVAKGGQKLMSSYSRGFNSVSRTYENLTDVHRKSQQKHLTRRLHYQNNIQKKFD